MTRKTPNNATNHHLPFLQTTADFPILKRPPPRISGGNSVAPGRSAPDQHDNRGDLLSISDDAARAAIITTHTTTQHEFPREQAAAQAPGPGPQVLPPHHERRRRRQAQLERAELPALLRHQPTLQDSKDWRLSREEDGHRRLAHAYWVCPRIAPGRPCQNASTNANQPPAMSRSPLASSLPSSKSPPKRPPSSPRPSSRFSTSSSAPTTSP